MYDRYIENNYSDMNIFLKLIIEQKNIYILTIKYKLSAS